MFASSSNEDSKDKLKRYRRIEKRRMHTTFKQRPHKKDSSKRKKIEDIKDKEWKDYE